MRFAMPDMLMSRHPGRSGLVGWIGCRAGVFAWLVALWLLPPGHIAAAAALGGFVEPSHAALAQTAVRLGLVDLAEDPVVDEYARLVHCDLYQAYFDNEFEWAKLRQAIRQSAEQSLPTMPLRFGVLGTVRLGRYDLDRGGFRLARRTPLENVSFLPLMETSPPLCDGPPYRLFKPFITAALQRPITIRLVPLTPREADALRARMVARENENRVLVIRFNISILRARPDLGGGPDDPTWFLSAFPESVELFEDLSLEEPVYRFLGPDQQQYHIPSLGEDRR